MATQYVGIDLHRRRSVIVRHDANGEVVEKVRIDTTRWRCRARSRRPVPTRRWCWRPRTAGTRRLTCCRLRAPKCIWPIPSG